MHFNKNVVKLIQVISDQSKKHDLVLKALDEHMVKKVPKMTVPELMNAFEVVSHASRKQTRRLPRWMSHEQ